MIYADGNGSTPVLPEIRKYLAARIDSPLWANPNAIHSLGVKLKKGMEKCRAITADTLGAEPHQVIWNSGVSEGLSQIIQHLLLNPTQKKRIVYVSAIEHAAILNALAYYEKNWGFELRWIPVKTSGVIDLDWLTGEVKKHGDKVAMLTCMAANNETGVIQPWEAVRDLCQSQKIPFLCDTTQWIGRMPFHFNDSGLEWAMASGHKLGALPGTGFLLAREPLKLTPLIWGGGQEDGVRGGTQNYLGLETIAIALQGMNEKLARALDHHNWREKFESGLKKEFKQLQVIGAELPRLPATSLIGFPGIHGQGVQIELEAQDIFVTTSAACSDNEPATSKVLKAMGIDDTLGRSVIRISFPLSAGASDYDQTARALHTAYTHLNRMKAY